MFLQLSTAQLEWRKFQIRGRSSITSACFGGSLNRGLNKLHNLNSFYSIFPKLGQAIYIGGPIGIIYVWVYTEIEHLFMMLLALQISKNHPTIWKKIFNESKTEDRSPSRSYDQMQIKNVFTAVNSATRVTQIPD